ncbi:MAG: hypothetical protein RLZZ241_2602 [Bacteroidota bacterium]|jgi:hypothetical protein
MMDELEFLKRDWQQREQNLPKLNYQQIHQMIWRQSSSLVRWIFYISIIEFLAPHLLYLIPSFREGMNYELAERLGINTPLVVITVLQYSVALFFIGVFYKRYREISVLDTTGKLMERILQTRKAVLIYVLFSLGMILLVFGIFIEGIFFSNNLIDELHLTPPEHVDPNRLKWIVMGIMALSGILFTGLIAGIYYLIYGMITRKLKANYKELEKLEP